MLGCRLGRQARHTLAVAVGVRSDLFVSETEPDAAPWRHRVLPTFGVLPRLGLVRHCDVGTRPRKVTVDERDWLAERFQAHRPHLTAVAYRMLGSFTEAEDAVQGAWLRPRRSRPDPSEVHNLGGWLTTLVARECLDLLRARSSRHEEPLGVHLPEPVVSGQGGVDPEEAALRAAGGGVGLPVGW